MNARSGSSRSAGSGGTTAAPLDPVSAPVHDRMTAAIEKLTAGIAAACPNRRDSDLLLAELVVVVRLIGEAQDAEWRGRCRALLKAEREHRESLAAPCRNRYAREQWQRNEESKRFRLDSIRRECGL